MNNNDDIDEITSNTSIFDLDKLDTVITAIQNYFTSSSTSSFTSISCRTCIEHSMVQVSSSFSSSISSSIGLRTIESIVESNRLLNYHRKYPTRDLSLLLYCHEIVIHDSVCALYQRMVLIDSNLVS
jgi:hypothetical protein